jgi:sigma-E factor negative regulatory protein RseA
MKDEAMNDELPDDRNAALSRAMDGDPDATDAALRAYGADADARADWHAWHLIGDVLRSADSASTAARDAAFVGRLRERLAAEPAPLWAPAPHPPRRPIVRQRWMAGAAMAAGFAAVAIVMVVTRGSAPDAAAPTLASASAPASSIGADVVLVRNADLDRYLAAHRQYAPMSTLAAPGGFVRSADVAAAPGR